MASADGSSVTPAQKQALLTPVLSLVAGMVDVIGFLALGGVFTAHITGNVVALAARAVHGDSVYTTQALAIPVFMLAVAATWLLAKASRKDDPRLPRRLLLVQFVLLAAVLLFSVITHASANPHTWAASVAIMLAVCSMACQFALIRLALPHTVSTAVMTGNLTSAILASLETVWGDVPMTQADRQQLRETLPLLLGFLVGCAVGAVAVSLIADWAWVLPVALAGLALALRRHA